VRRVLLRLITAIQLTRLTIAFGAVSDIWFVILLTQAQDDYVMVDVHAMPLAAALAAGAVVAVGLFGYGAALNDVLDVRHDAAFSPGRPIPAGRIRVGQAIVLTVGSLIVAIVGAAFLGRWSVWIALVTATGIIFYNTTGKFIPALGIVTIGLVHASHMYIPNHELTFTLPVWLVMTHSMAIAALVHELEDKRPRLGRRALVGAACGWAFWSAAILGAGAVQTRGLWPADLEPRRLIVPAFAVVAFAVVAWLKTRRVTGRAAAEKLKRYGAMWQSLYGAAWLFALDLVPQSVAIGLFAVAGFIAMTLIKELTGVSGEPISWRA
jgi:hypothetical protein